MEKWTDRTQILIGEKGLACLQKSRILLFGVGGVGGAVFEALVRSGVGFIRLIDADVVAPSNLNRQRVATQTTLGQPKVEVAKQIAQTLNPNMQVETHQAFVTNDAPEAWFEDVDCVIDCIDTVTAKRFVIEMCRQKHLPVFVSMGAGNRYNPTLLKLADLSQTHGCTLARVMRRELRKQGIRHLPVVYSLESPQRPYALEVNPDEANQKGKLSPGSMMLVPATAGLYLAGSVLEYLLGEHWPGQRTFTPKWDWPIG